MPNILNITTKWFIQEAGNNKINYVLKTPPERGTISPTKHFYIFRTIYIVTILFIYLVVKILKNNTPLAHAFVLSRV